jgi:protein SCO1
VRRYPPAAVGAYGAKAYRVYCKKQAGNSGEDYLMEHSAFVYVINPAGTYTTLFSPRGGQGPDQMALRLRELIAASSRY